ncbi:MAG: M15 family metallopeptidase [Lentimicrobiaceae bacterium]|jgi:D-alanyl-D-alanine dipeptidase|nr:M15 family metallopeptidase [Lentimicrobiaceae bacterium]MCP4910388.1 M15 family metallopeptidase [Bacteroidota bacterium]
MRQLAIIVLSILPTIFVGQNNYNYNKNLVVISDTSYYLMQLYESSSYELVDIKEYVPGIKLDIKYATPNNLIGEKIYPVSMAIVRRPLAESLYKVQQSLNNYGLGLVIFDGYRPYGSTVRIYELFKDTNIIASPWQGSHHNRGTAVDVSLIDLEYGQEIQMPTGYDNFSQAAYSNYQNLPKNVLKNRDILISEMQNHGFKVNPKEWWHFDFIGWQEYDIMDLSFEQIEQINRKKLINKE